MEAVFWRSVCSATAAIAADVNVFTDNPEAEVAEDALVALTPSGCEQWCAQIWRNVCAHGSQVCNTAPRTADTGAAGDFGVAKQLLAAMVACVDFDDDANRKAAVKMCLQLVQETCSLECAPPIPCVESYGLLLPYGMQQSFLIELRQLVLKPVRCYCQYLCTSAVFSACWYHPPAVV